MEHGIGSTLHCPAGNLHLSTFQSDGLTGLEAICETRLLRRGLHFSGELDLSAIQSVLQGVGGRAIDAEVWQPTYGGARCYPDTGDHENVSDSLECRYSFEKGETASGGIKVSFGYTVTETVRTIGILGLLLLVPIVSVLWLRRRAMTGARRGANHHLVRLLPIPPVDSACGSADLVGCNRSSGSRQPRHVPASVLEMLRFGDGFDGALDCAVATGSDRVRSVPGSFRADPRASGREANEG